MHDGDCYVEPLARGRTVIMYDQRGGGRSELLSDPARLTASAHVRDLEALRQHFRLERMDLIALSWGAGLAAMYAAEYPALVNRILIAAPMPIAQDPYATARRSAVDAALGTTARARLTEISQLMANATDDEAVRLCRETFDIGARPYLKKPENWTRESCNRCDVPPAAIRNRAVIARATMGSIGAWDFRPLLRRLTMPVLIMEGADSVVPLDSTREWAALAPNARLLLFRDAGHLFPVEQPERFRAAADEFLSGRFPKDAATVSKLGGR
jgi:proline iminopeptidase